MRPTAVQDNARLSNTARESMARLGIPDTPQNFEVWRTYHLGSKPDLNQAIDILLSNHREFNEQTNEELFEFFLGTAREHQIILETTERVSTALDALIRFINEAGDRASTSREALRGLPRQMVAGRPLAELLDTLIAETKTIEEHSRLLQERLVNSSTTIDHLRKNIEDVQRDAFTDALTGVGNRKLFDSALRQAAMQVMETGDELSLLLIDIDHFKKFNDTWGHQTGDEVLKLFAKSLAGEVRQGDTAARYGGEEFAAILPKTGLDEAVRIGNRIRASLESAEFVDRKTGKTVGRITTSIGAAFFEPGEPLNALISRADGALYAAKRDGRNRIVVAPPGTAHAA